MTRVQELFIVHKGRGAYLSEVSPGATPLISCTMDNNGVLALVDMEPTFRAPAITVGRVSGIAFVQTRDFATVPDDMAVLEPRTPMPVEHLYIVAALINEAQWRFSYYRKLTPPRLGLLQIPFEEALRIDPQVPEPRALVPPHEPTKPSVGDLRVGLITITDLFDMSHGDIHNASGCEPGNIPLISCSDWNNGIHGYIKVEGIPLYRNAITVAYNGSPLTAKYHHYTFAAKDDVAVLRPKVGVGLETVLYVVALLNAERWRYSYYRKCYHQKLTQLKIPVPVDRHGAINYEVIRGLVVSSSSYWRYLKSRWAET